MRKSMAKKVLAASMAAAMTMSAAACGEKPVASVSTEPVVSASVEEEVYPYTVLRDENGNIYDLGGVTITIRDWFANPDQEAKTDYEEERNAYREWVQETYNFKVVEAKIGDWGSVAQDFIDYASAEPDDNNYVFTLHANDPALLSAIDNGLVYDLATLDCLDFTEAKFTLNNCHKFYTFNGSTYAMHTGPAEPRCGVYMNLRLLEDAGIKADDIYDMQANGTWTWDAFTDLCEKVLQNIGDQDKDGTVDIWPIAVNEGNMTKIAIFSNGGCLVSQDADGTYVYRMDDPEVQEALEWTRDTFTKYDWNGPVGEDGSAPSWDYYQGQFKSGQAVFLIDDQYCATPGNLFYDMEDQLGFVMFPAGPKGSLVQVSADNAYIIPATYDADRAWKCAFAYTVYNELIPGYEDFNPYINTTRTGNFDTRACEETIPLMGTNAVVDLSGVIPNSADFLNQPFFWSIGPNCAPISEIMDGMRDMAKSYIADANKKYNGQ